MSLVEVRAIPEKMMSRLRGGTARDLERRPRRNLGSVALDGLVETHLGRRTGISEPQSRELSRCSVLLLLLRSETLRGRRNVPHERDRNQQTDAEGPTDHGDVIHTNTFFLGGTLHGGV